MGENEAQSSSRLFMDIPNAAGVAGFSLRHFRRIMKEDQIRRIKIGRKFFILAADFTRWQDNKKTGRTEQATDQIVAKRPTNPRPFVADSATFGDPEEAAPIREEGKGGRPEA